MSWKMGGGDLAGLENRPGRDVRPDSTVLLADC